MRENEQLDDSEGGKMAVDPNSNREKEKKMVHSLPTEDTQQKIEMNERPVKLMDRY